MNRAMGSDSKVLSPAAASEAMEAQAASHGDGAAHHRAQPSDARHSDWRAAAALVSGLLLSSHSFIHSFPVGASQSLRRRSNARSFSSCWKLCTASSAAGKTVQDVDGRTHVECPSQRRLETRRRFD